MQHLVVITGPTAAGKTDLSIRLARRWDTSIVSCDSRQFYKEMRIGTAVPDEVQLDLVPHYFIGNLSVRDYYSAFRFEQDAISLLADLFRDKDRIIMTGGSGLYMDAVLNGIDDIPDPDPEIRNRLRLQLETGGMDPLLEQLATLDPEYYGQVDRKNPARVLRGLEVCLITGRTFTSFRIRKKTHRDFNTILIGLDLPRKELHDRIDRRVDRMMADGLLEEARGLIPYRRLSALNTVGYRELFSYLDGKIPLDEAIRLIKRNTRRYARRQITWNNRYPEIRFFHPSQFGETCEWVEGFQDRPG